MSFARMNASVLWMDRRHYGIKSHVLDYERPMLPSPAALVVAHPGHELRVHRWLEIARPLVFVITDGSGSGRSRIRSTTDLLATAGSIMGAFTDQEINRLMLNGDVDRQLNFGARTLRRPITTDAIGAEIDRYDPADAAAVCNRIRQSADIDLLVDQYVDLYDELCARPPVDGNELLSVSRSLSRMAAQLYAHVGTEQQAKPGLWRRIKKMRR
jgi:hypothetical protein